MKTRAGVGRSVVESGVGVTGGSLLLGSDIEVGYGSPTRPSGARSTVELRRDTGGGLFVTGLQGR